MTSPTTGTKRGAVTRETNPSTPAPPATTEITSRLLEAFEGCVAAVVNTNFETHRLSYIYEDDDNRDEIGNAPILFVCRCTEAFDRRSYNEHIRDKYKEVG